MLSLELGKEGALEFLEQAERKFAAGDSHKNKAMRLTVMFNIGYLHEMDGQIGRA